MVPQSFEPKKDINVYVQMLNPVSYETIEGKLFDNENKTFGTGTLNLNSGRKKQYSNRENKCLFSLELSFDIAHGVQGRITGRRSITSSSSAFLPINFQQNLIIRL